MDPNATLEVIRRMLAANEEDMDVGELCCAVRDLDDWLLSVADTVLKDLGLWMEHPAATKGWAHVQLRPQGSYARTGRRWFYP